MNECVFVLEISLKSTFLFSQGEKLSDEFFEEFGVNIWGFLGEFEPKKLIFYRTIMTILAPCGENVFCGVSHKHSYSNFCLTNIFENPL